MLRSIFALLVILGFQSGILAQNNCRIYSTDSAELQVCYFTTGQMSTSIAHRKSSAQWNTLKAYDIKGKLIYDKSYGHRNGAGNVDVSYNADGSLASARYTLQPDDATGHTDITTFFKADGSIDHEEDHSLVNSMPDITSTHPVSTPATPSMRVVQAPIPVASPGPKSFEVISVSGITELYLINYTSESLHIKAQYKSASASPMYRDIEPSDSINIGIYYTKSVSESPLDHYTLTIETKPRKGYEYRLDYLRNNNSNRQYATVTFHKQ